MEDIDAFLNLDGEEFFPTEEVKEVKEVKEGTVCKGGVNEPPTTPPPPPPQGQGGSSVVSTSDFVRELETDLPELCGDGYSEDFIKMVERVKAAYRMLPVLQYSLLYRELADLSVTSSPTPTLQVLNDEIQRVQRAKDRLSEIMIKVLECHNIKKRLVDTLITAWGKFTVEKNAEARKGDGEFRLSNFTIDLAKAESLLKVCNHILKNLDSLHDSLSRRITINQLLLKMNDMGRGSLPDYRISDGSRDMGIREEDIFGKSSVNSSESVEASEENWD